MTENVFRKRKYRIDPKLPKIEKICYLETWYVNTDIDFKKIQYEDWVKQI